MRHVAKSFSDPNSGAERLILDDFTLRVGAGESIAILGPSGCGKTTLLRLIAGLDEPSNEAAEILVGGEAIRGPGPDRGFMFQQYSSFPWLTAEANVLLALRQSGIEEPEATRRAAEYLALVGLENYRKSYPGRLSGGQQQRLALARTLAAKPAVMLLDEPYASLDAQTRESMQTELLRIWQELRPTILFVTHDIREAIRVGEKVLLLSRSPSSIVLERTTIPLEARVALCEARNGLDGQDHDGRSWLQAAYLLERDLRSALAHT